MKHTIPKDGPFYSEAIKYLEAIAELRKDEDANTFSIDDLFIQLARFCQDYLRQEGFDYPLEELIAEIETHRLKNTFQDLRLPKAVSYE